VEIKNSCPVQIGTFVEMIATILMMISGMAASRVSSPTMISTPQIISTTPTNVP
jgi:hypothetical protein